MIASLALVMAAGAAAPAMAAGQTAPVGQRAHLSGGCDSGHRNVMDGLSSGGGDKDCKVKVHEVSRTVQVPPQGNNVVFTNVDAVCPAGEQAISGGFDGTQAVDVGVFAFRQATTNTPGDTWRNAVHNFSTTTAEPFTTFAYCAS
ncbi:hypothetical protein ACFYZE_14375 [Streptomyces sp. NPDC001796]|uniref:hypothetical protein n=1 Tax=Streptomyces sp. NPDC001796 TaxID=3364609 RepID=UPI0036A5520F